MRTDTRRDRRGFARRARLCALRALLKRIQCPLPSFRGSSGRCSTWRRGQTTAVRPSPPEPAPEPAPPPKPAAPPAPHRTDTTSGSKALQTPPPPAPEPMRYGDDTEIPEEDLEINPDATDITKVFVEQPPSPKFTAATGTFKAIRMEAEDAARVEEELTRTGEREAPGPPNRRVSIPSIPRVGCGDRSRPPRHDGAPDREPPGAPESNTGVLNSPPLCSVTQRPRWHLRQTNQLNIGHRHGCAQAAVVRSRPLSSRHKRGAAHAPGRAAPRRAPRLRKQARVPPGRVEAKVKADKQAAPRAEAGRRPSRPRGFSSDDLRGTPYRNRGGPARCAHTAQALLRGPSALPGEQPTSFFAGMWTAGSAILLLMLLIQVVNHYRDELAVNPGCTGRLRRCTHVRYHARAALGPCGV